MSPWLSLFFLVPLSVWQGVDETVVGRIASEHGRFASQSFINGDLLLFMFVVAGVAAGFAAGYWWRMLFSEKKGIKGKDGK